MIKCKLQKTREYKIIPKKEKERLKFGRYINSVYPIPEYGSKKWLVGVSIILEEKHPLTEENVNEITERCIAFLNTPPPSKHKLGRKPSKLVYGKFDDKPFRTIIKKTKAGKKYLQALLITEQRKNRVFWGEGPKVEFRKRKKRS